MFRATLFVASLIACCNALPQPAAAADPIDLGGRLEFVTQDYLVAETTGDLKEKVHQPQAEEVVLVTGKPWEGNTSAYYTIFRDGDLFRMYYRGSHWLEKEKKAGHEEVTCYAESKDGVHWTRPELGIVEFNGSTANNIILKGLGSHCFVAFRDENPNCAPDAKYKGISRGRPFGKKGLYVFKSADAIHWKRIREEPVITEGAFDSQNLAFWDPVTSQYVGYHRTFAKGVRSIMTCTSKDFVNWSKPVMLRYPGAPNQHLYTNAIRPYPRAPHIRVGFPTRYLPKGSSVEPLFMYSRDGVTFRRFNDPVIPQSAPKDRAGNRSNYMANGLVQLPGKPNEYSVYGTEAYYTGPDSRLRRFTYRVDGFLSFQGGKQGGRLTTKTLTFDGDRLVLNYAAHGGSVRVAVLDADGKPIPGLSLDDCQPLTGDAIAANVAWEKGKLPSGKAVRLVFEIKQADVYSLQFKR